MERVRIIKTSSRNRHKRKIDIRKVMLVIIIICIIALTTLFMIEYYNNNTNKRIDDSTENIETKLEEKQKTIDELNKQIEELKKEQKELKTTVEKIKVSRAQQKTVTSRGNSSSARVQIASGTKGTYQTYAKSLCLNTYKWSENDFNCLILLWNRESGWNPNAHNSSSGAHGIAQALPASKMASEGSDYLTNYQTQIKWGLKYIKNRYGSPSKAWSHFLSKNWY